MQIYRDGSIRRTNYNGVDYVNWSKNISAARDVQSNGVKKDDAYRLFMYRLLSHIAIVRVNYYKMYEELSNILTGEPARQLKKSMDFMTMFESDYIAYYNTPEDYVYDFELDIEEKTRQFVFVLNNVILQICWKKKYTNPSLIARIETTRLLVDMLITFFDMMISSFKRLKIVRSNTVETLIDNMKRCYKLYLDSIKCLYPSEIAKNDKNDDEMVLQSMTNLFTYIGSANNIMESSKAAYEINKNLFDERKKKARK